MTTPVSYPGYATPTFTLNAAADCWIVIAHPWDMTVGRVYDFGDVGWTAISNRSQPIGLFPDKQAAGEALVKHAGYEALR